MFSVEDIFRYKQKERKERRKEKKLLRSCMKAIRVSSALAPHSQHQAGKRKTRHGKLLGCARAHNRDITAHTHFRKQLKFNFVTC